MAPILWLLIVVLGLAFPVRGEETFVGCVKSAQGGATIRRGTETIPIREGIHLSLNDVLHTSADGRLGVILEDGTRISLGPNTDLTIDRFVYQPAAGKFALLLRLGRGVLAYISGKIASFSPESVTVETPVGVIGLRGTKFAITIEGA